MPSCLLCINGGALWCVLGIFTASVFNLCCVYWVFLLSAIYYIFDGKMNLHFQDIWPTNFLPPPFITLKENLLYVFIPLAYKFPMQFITIDGNFYSTVLLHTDCIYILFLCNLHWFFNSRWFYLLMTFNDLFFNLWQGFCISSLIMIG
jgi:hypothetical protein